MTAWPELLAEGFQLHPPSLPWIHLAWLAPALFLVYLHSFYRKRLALRAFASAEVLSNLIPSVSRKKEYVKCAMVLGATLLTVVAIARPQWGTDLAEIRRKGIDLVVALDLSKSMLAEDVPPNRLEWAKADLKELLGGLTGDRIALVAFAGRAEIRCPLTFDYGFFRRILDELKVGSVAMGGTNLSAGIHQALECFQDNVKNHKALLLITDGEDHEAFVKEAAEKARERGVRIFSIGVGDTGEGKRIPITDASGNRIYQKDKEGREIWTRMDPRALLDAAQVTDGGYAPAYLRKEGDPAGGVTTVRDIYQRIQEKVTKKELEGAKEERYQDRFQWFLGPAFVFLALEPLIRTRKRSPARGGTPQRAAGAAAKAAVGAAVLLALAGAARPAGAGEFERMLREGNRLYAEGQYAAAEEKYLQARTEKQEAAEVSYNIANTYFQRGEFQKAIELYGDALAEARERDLEGRVRYNRACAQARESERFVKDLADAENLQKGVDLLREAIAGFRDVLEIEPAHAAAQTNLSISQLRIKSLLDRLKRLREEAEKQNAEDKDRKSPVEALKELIAEEKAEIGLTRSAVLAGEEKATLEGQRERLGRLPEGSALVQELDSLLLDPALVAGGAELSDARKLALAGETAQAARKVAEALERIGAEIGKREESRAKDIEKDREDQSRTMVKALGLASSLRDLAEGKAPAPAGQAPAPPPQPPPPPEVKERLSAVAGLTEEAGGKMAQALPALGERPAAGEAPPPSGDPASLDLTAAEAAQRSALELLEKALEEAEKLPREKPPPEGEKKEEKDQEKDQKSQEKKDQEGKDKEKDQEKGKNQETKDQGKDEKKEEMTREEAEQALRKFLEKDADRRRDKERRMKGAGAGRAALDKDW